MKKNAPKTCFVVIEECRTKNCDETNDCIAVCLTEEGAKAKLKNCKESIHKDWNNIIDLNDDWEENETEHCYELYRESDFEYYYSVRYEEKELMP